MRNYKNKQYKITLKWIINDYHYGYGQKLRDLKNNLVKI